MRTYKAFLHNEMIILKRNLILMPLFQLISIGFVIAPYMNQFNLSQIHYSEEIAGIIAFLGCVFGISMFACVNVTQSVAFEKSEGMDGFLFSQDINKITYIFSKITIPIIMAVIGAILPIIVYYCFNLYPVIRVGIIPMFMYILTVVIIWTLIAIICTSFAIRDSDVGLISFSLVTLFVIGFGMLTKPWYYPLWVSIIAIIFVILILFIVTYLLLCKREILIKFERHN